MSGMAFGKPSGNSKKQNQKSLADIMKNTDLKRRDNSQVEKRPPIEAKPSAAMTEEEVRLLLRRESFSGPLPPPEALQAYESTLSGLANRIVVMAEEEQKARFREIDLRAEEARNAAVSLRRGQWFAFLALGILSLSALGCAALKMPWVGCALAGTTLVGAVTAFLETRKNKTPPK